MIFLPLALSALLMAAHFLRAGALLPLLISLAAPFLLLTRRRWSLRLVQALSLLGALIWLDTLRQIIRWRQALGQPWTTSALILGLVAAFTLLAAALLERPAARRHFR